MGHLMYWQLLHHEYFGRPRKKKLSVCFSYCTLYLNEQNKLFRDRGTEELTLKKVVYKWLPVSDSKTAAVAVTLQGKEFV